MILTQKYRTFLATRFLNSITSGNNVAYIFVGRSLPWVDSANVAINDSNPPVPTTDVQSTFGFWRQMLYAKRVATGNAQFVVARRDWVTAAVYAQYDDQDAALMSKAFYVLDGTPAKVYKCLWNNHGALSTVAPSTIGTSVSATATGDGYVWKYLYSVGTSSFLTSSWMPVLANATVQSTAVTQTGTFPTAVPLLVTDGGLGYNPAVNTVVTLVGDGSGASVANSGVQIIGGRVSDIRMALGGNGYSQVTSINVFQSGVSSQASARAIIPPFPNHGYDPVKELGAAAVMFVSTLSGTETGNLTVINSYRRIGLLVDPLLAANGLSVPTVANATSYRMTTDITMSANTGVLQPNDVITNMSLASKPTAAVVDVVQVASNYVVRLTNVNDMGETTPFATGNTLRNLASGVEVTVGTIDLPLLLPFSGNILCVEQRTPISRDAALNEDIKLVFPLN